MIVNTAKIIFKNLPLYPVRFDILKIESKKKESSRGRATRRALSFLAEGFFGRGVGAMIKKKAKVKTVAKKAGKKKGARKMGKEPNPAEVRKEISLMVESEAAVIAQAMIDEGKKGQVATGKYLFEFASIYPAATDGSQTTPQEDCLAKTLMNRLGLPEEPVKREEEDSPETAEVRKEETVEVGVAAAEPLS